MTAAQRMNTPGFERVLAAQIFPCFTIGCWNQTKTVYDFDYEFQKMLMDTDDVAIHQDILQRLPVRDFFIPVYDSYDYNGMFVHVEFDEKEKTTAFGIVLVGPTKGSHDDFTFLTLPAWAKENQSLTEATRSTKEYLEKAAGQRQVNGISVPAVMEAVPSVFDGGTPYVRLAILCANYLASKNPDVRLESTSRHIPLVRMRPKNTKRMGKAKPPAGGITGAAMAGNAGNASLFTDGGEGESWLPILIRTRLGSMNGSMTFLMLSRIVF